MTIKDNNECNDIVVIFGNYKSQTAIHGSSTKSVSLQDAYETQIKDDLKNFLTD
ncbi:hypothetical protein Glove_184g145 [Diversispora epigaea]|uniref:Uncharacterized protein n=1 Tax=Diversispora epigaea TaxID=1348612 RepID=A0A397IQU6_9GLOM|nr:hypothetical protein Glove_184g145 [Diversispora epigaea]